MRNTRLVSTEIAGGRLLVDAVVPAGSEPTAAKDAVLRVMEVFDLVNEVVGELAAKVAASLSDAEQGLKNADEVSFEFGFGITTSGSLILTSASAEASLAVTLTYKNR